MTQNIEKLFEETKTIILPGLGALTITNPDTKELMFMAFLKHDDGVLSGFIEKTTGISSEEAKKIVSDEVESIKKQLDGGKTVSFGNFGQFAKDADGEVIFENTSKDTPKEEKQKEDAPAATVTPEQKEKPAEKIPTPAPKQEVKAEPKPEIKEAPKEEKKVSAPVVTPAEKAKKSEATNGESATKSSSAKDASATTKVQEEKPKESKIETPKPSKTAAATETKPSPEKKDEAPKPRSSTEKKEPKKDIKIATTAAATADAKGTKSEESAGARVKSEKEKNILEKEELAANLKKLEALKKKRENTKKKSKRGPAFYILMFLFLIIIAGGAFVALNYDTAKDYIPFLAEDKAAKSSVDEEAKKLEKMVGDTNETSQELEPAVEADSSDMVTDENSGSQEVKEEEETTPVAQTPPPKVVSSSNNKPFHIVAGVFTTPSNAERLAEKIRGMGYPAKTFARGTQTVVSVQSFSTNAEAQAALSETKDAAPSGWVLEWR